MPRIMTGATLNVSAQQLNPLFLADPGLHAWSRSGERTWTGASTARKSSIIVNENFYFSVLRGFKTIKMMTTKEICVSCSLKGNFIQFLAF